jgi:hypothetical protein
LSLRHCLTSLLRLSMTVGCWITLKKENKILHEG